MVCSPTRAIDVNRAMIQVSRHCMVIRCDSVYIKDLHGILKGLFGWLISVPNLVGISPKAVQIYNRTGALDGQSIYTVQVLRTVLELYQTHYIKSTHLKAHHVTLCFLPANQTSSMPPPASLLLSPP